MTFEPGDVVVTTMDFTDLSGKKRRPAVVLSSRASNEGPDLVVCAITSNPKDTMHSVLIEPADMSEPRLGKTSRIKVGKITTLQKALVLRVMGRIKPGTMTQVWKEFHALFPPPGP